MDIRTLQDGLRSRVIGQDRAIEILTNIIAIFAAGMNPPARPAGAILLAGPTGVGKTLLAEALAQELHGSERDMIWVHCAEYTNDHEVSKLIGAPPGYLGHRETKPVITAERLRSVRSSNCVPSILLFDEIEKAARTVHQLLLGMLDKGTLHLGDGGKVDLTQTLIIMTSNLGARQIAAAARQSFGFAGPGERVLAPAQIEGITRNAIERFFSPEFVNRLDAVVSCMPLREGEANRIAELELKKVINRVSANVSRISYDGSVIRWLVERGFSPVYGARAIRRVVEDSVLRQIAFRVIRGEIHNDDGINLRIENGELVIEAMRICAASY